MFSRFASLRVRHSTVAAYTALFLTLGGTSYAVATGSIDSREIKNNTVRSKDVRNNEIRSSDVRNSSLLARDFKQGELPAGPRGATGATGGAGPRGPQGVPGSPGRDGFEFVLYSFSDDAALPANGSNSATAECPEGTFPTGGGGTVFDTQGTPDVGDDVEITNGESVLNRSIIDFEIPGWAATMSNTTAETDRVLVAMAACVPVDEGDLRTRNRTRR